MDYPAYRGSLWFAFLQHVAIIDFFGRYLDIELFRKQAIEGLETFGIFS